MEASCPIDLDAVLYVGTAWTNQGCRPATQAARTTVVWLLPVGRADNPATQARFG